MSSDEPLPGELSKWPADPYALLGLSSAADAKEAKRAYLKLARHYKPEHEPEKFKRLRKAFEQVQQQIEFRLRYESVLRQEESQTASSDEQAPGDEPLFNPQAEQILAEFGRLAPRSLREDDAARGESPRGTPGDLDGLWDAACRGEEALAYAGLLAQRHLHSRPSDAYVRLYWLLTANRSLDSQRTPCDWLAEGLIGTNLAGPLRELYRRELAANPYEAVGTRCAALLETPAAAGNLADLLEWRWQGASRLGQWDLILDDLRRVRPKIVFDDEETWGRLLLLVIDYLVWLESREAAPVLESCRKELDQLAHLHARLGDEYDRLDLLIDVVAGWHRLRFATDVPAAWTSLLPMSWNQTPEALRQRFASLLKSLGERPAQALRTFDALAKHSKAAASHLGQSLERLWLFDSGCEDRNDHEAIKHLVRRFARSTRGEYAASRELLLQFCLTESLDPLWIGRIVNDLPREPRADDESWTDAIAADGPLRYVYLGYRAYWG